MGGLVRLVRARQVKRAKRRIKQLFREGLIEYPGHAVERLMKRGLDMNDVRSAIHSGTVTKCGASGYPRTPRRCMVEGRGADGARICIVDTNGALVLVSAWVR